MDVSTLRNGEVFVICPKGKLIGEPHCLSFTTSVNNAIHQKERKIVLDLSGIDWMNSSGIAMLLSAREKLQQAKIHFRLASLSKPVSEVISISKLDLIFEIQPTVDAAVKSLG